MSESVPNEALPDDLDQKRLLTEVEHLLAHRRADGTYDQDVVRDIRPNLRTAVQEIAMPYAVSTTIQRVGEEISEDGRRQRIFSWLGRSAVGVALSGYEYHFSKPAYARVDVEVAEAQYSQEHARTGVSQVFISPKMSRFDAPIDLAKQEHLHADDAIRVSSMITDHTGNVIARRLQSLLVRDVPLEAWVRMLKDPQNILGRAFELRDERSAVSVMELFSQLEMPEEALEEGPVTLVAAVVPYIQEKESADSVKAQLRRFRADQEMYERIAEEKTDEWLQFELELAESIYTGRATLEIRRFIATLQHEWGDEDLASIQEHATADGLYRMSRELAARLEKAKQNILNSEAAITTGNEKVLRQMDERSRAELQDRMRFIDALRSSGVNPDEIARQRAELTRAIARQNITVGGGCAGDNEAKFRDGKSDNSEGTAGSSSEGDKKSWKWKSGVCRVRSCPSPKPTEVGPCSVCRNCQHVFDSGGDPTKKTTKPPKPASPIRLILAEPKPESEAKAPAPPEAGDKKPQAAGKLLLAGMV